MYSWFLLQIEGTLPDVSLKLVVENGNGVVSITEDGEAGTVFKPPGSALVLMTWVFSDTLSCVSEKVIQMVLDLGAVHKFDFCFILSLSRLMTSMTWTLFGFALKARVFWSWSVGTATVWEVFSVWRLTLTSLRAHPHGSLQQLM